MPTRNMLILLTAFLVVASSSDLLAQATRTFLGGNPSGPTDWNNNLNWQGFIAPSTGDNVVISQDAFAIAGSGTRDLNQVTLGSSATPSARLEITQTSSMTIRSAFSVNTGRLDIAGALRLNDGVQVFVSAGGTVRMDDGVSESQRGFLNLGANGIVFLDGLMEVGPLGTFNMGSSSGGGQVNIGSTGELRVVGGRLTASVGSVYQLADGAGALLSGTIGQTVDFRLNGASSRVVVEQSDALSMGSLVRRPNLQSDVGGQVIYRGKGTMVSGNMSGSHVRATVENETTLIQRDSTSGVSLTLQNLAQQIYLPDVNDAYMNSLGGPLTVSGQATLGLTSDFNEERFFITSARLNVNNRLITNPGSTLHISRTGSDIADGGGRFTVNMTSLQPWEIGANSTLVVNDWVTLEGVGLTYLSNSNLTTQLEGISTLDLTNSFGNRIINRLNGNSPSSRVEAGSNQLTINGGDFRGQIFTSGGLRIGGDTTLRFPNSYSGGTEILEGGTLRLAGIGRLGSGPITIHGTLDVSAIDASSLLFTALGGAGLLQHGTTRINLSVPASGSTTMAISFQGSGSLAKEGAGILRLTGNSTGTGQGDFLVNAGTALVDGQMERRFEVKAGAALGGSGRAGEVLLRSGGLISPGNSTGTFFSQSTTWEAGAGYRWEINHAEGTPGGSVGWDTLHIDGSLTLIPSALSRFTILVTSLGLDQTPGATSGFALNQIYDFTLVTTTDGIEGFAPSGVELLTSGFDDGLGDQGTFSIFQDGNDLVLRYQTIPEPSGALLLILAGALLAAHRRHARASGPVS